MRQRRVRSRLVFIVGGASSGKSGVALQLAAEGAGKAARRAFVATGEGLDEEIIADLTAQLRRVVPKKTQIMAISSQAGTGLKPLLYELKKQVVRKVFLCSTFYKLTVALYVLGSLFPETFLPS